MRKRILKYDVVRVFAILGVVATHTEVITSSMTNYVGGLSWWLGNLLHSLVSISVPLFVMLTGALLLKRPQLKYSYIWPKVIFQFVIPLLLWWSFYYTWSVFRPGLPFQLSDFLDNFFLTTIGPLYYLQVAIGLYLVLPLIQKLLQPLPSAQKKIALVTFTAIILMYKMLSFLVFRTYDTTNMFFIFVPYVVYLGWGAVLSQVKLQKPQVLGLSIISSILVVLISGFTYWNVRSFNLGHTLFWSKIGGNFFWNPFTLLVLGLACVIFVILINLDKIMPELLITPKTTQLLTRSVMAISTASFGIYLIHPLIMDILDNLLRMSIQFVTYPLWIWLILRTALIFGASLIVTTIVMRIPGIKLLFGKDSRKITQLS